MVIKPERDDPSVIRHTIEVYVGGKDGDKLYFDKPTISGEDGKQRLLFPNEARLYNYSYVSDIYADILIKYTFQDSLFEEHELTRVKIGSIPIMLHSRLCGLYKQGFNTRVELGECPYDQGGYFVINGKEKVCVAQERSITNALFVSHVNDPKDKYAFSGFIRCTTESSIFPKTIRFFVYGHGQAQFKKVNAIEVVVPNINVNIPLFILFRVLGIESDKDIIDAIVRNETDEQLKEDMVDFIRASVIDSNFAYSQNVAVEYLKSYVDHKSADSLYMLIERDLFTNLENVDNVKKGQYLGYLVNDLVKICMGVSPETDRDSYKAKRIGISGFLLGDIFKDYYNSFRVTFRNLIDKAYEYKKWYQSDSLMNNINNSNKSEMFKDSIITNGLMKSLKGSWGLHGDKGIVQDLNRLSFIGTLSHLRRVNSPMDPSMKLRKPRQLLTNQYGMICPSESPDGGSIGLLKNFSIMCMISFDVPVSTIKDALKPFNPIYQEDMGIYDTINKTRILINNTWVAVVETSDAATIVQWIRLLRRNALINSLVSVAWDYMNKEISILCDNGRCTRPLLIVKKNKLTIKSAAECGSWLDCLCGSTIEKDEFDFYFTGYHDPFVKYPGKKITEIMALLETQSAPIEYIDVQETDNIYIAMYQHDLVNNKFSHCEIHPSTMFSIYTITLPFANHNNHNRIVFSGAQGKQAIGVYATNFNNRIDTIGLVLHYVQKPLVKTRFCDYVNTTQLPNGENVIVAICSYTGYNQEDSIILNKSAIERGMFNTSYYKCYEGEEKDADGEKIIFANKNTLTSLGENIQVKPGRYENIDENGLPIIGSHIHEHDAFLGKYSIQENVEIVDEYGNEAKTKTYTDRSEIADKTTAGTIDKVLLFKNSKGLNEVKIRMRKFRIPELGDKLCSRHGQKGVCGMIMSHEDMPFTKDGLVPDIIINPHAFPTRLTIGHLMECIMAKTCLVKGCEYDAVAFEKHDIDSFYGDLEKRFEMNKYGDEILYNGRNGEQIATEIFIGPTYYQRLKHMVADKINYRTTGRVMGLTKQPTKGRSNEGGLRIGEMEANAIISHGMSAFIKEAFFERSDKYQFYIKKFENVITGKNRFNKRIMSPFAFKLLMQELQSMCIDPRLITDTDFDHEAEEIHDHLSDIEDEDEYDGDE
jgi:DNA-directed RNA polymerase II subunit RPB2